MKLFKLGTALGALLLASVGVAQAQQVVRVGYAPFGAPIASLPGATPDNYKTLDPSGAQGAMVDLINAIAKDAGFQVQFLPFVSGDSLPALSSNKIDIVLTSGINADSKAAADILPVFSDSDVLIANKNDLSVYKSYDDLKTFTVGSRTGTIYENDMKKNGLAVKSYASGPELYKAVDSGEIKVAINTSYSATAYAIQQGQYPNTRIVNSYQPSVSSSVGIAARKDDTALLQKIAASLGKLKADGTARAIFMKYGVDGLLVK